MRGGAAVEAEAGACACADDGIAGTSASHCSASTSAETRCAGRASENAESSEAGPAGTGVPSFCASAVRTRSVHSLITIGSVASRRPIALNECMSAAKPGYLQTVCRYKFHY